MIVLINAVSIREGGSLVVLTRLLQQLTRLPGADQWHVTTGDAAVARALSGIPGVKAWLFPWANASPAHVKLWYEWTLPGLVRRLGADCVFSQTNYLPDRHLAAGTLLLVQNAGHFSAEFERLTQEHAPGPLARWAWHTKKRWVRRSIARADSVIVQTAALKSAIAAQTALPEGRIAVVPHGAGQVEPGAPRELRERGSWRIGYFTHFGVQKNFGVLFRAGRVLLDKGIDIELAICIDPQSPDFGWVAREMRDAGFPAESVRNMGRVAGADMSAAYDTLDLSVFPSWCESFGFPLAESMARGLPTLAADTGSNREVGAGGAIFFTADDHHALARHVESLMRDRNAYRAASSRSLARSAELSWETAARSTMALLQRVARPRAEGKGSVASMQAQTRAHYDSHPLDFLHADDPDTVSDNQPRFFSSFVRERLAPGLRVADIGCGPGRATKFLADRGMEVYGVDISAASLRLARARAPAGHYVCATNLNLPLRDGAFDAVVSDGVIHHTAVAAQSFQENARLVGPGGYLYLGVYRRHRYYYYLYTYLGGPLRWLAQWGWGRLLVCAMFLPPYYALHLVKSRGRRSWYAARNFFFDYLLTPTATFHTYEEVCAWGRQAGLALLAYEPDIGNVHGFVFRRNPEEVNPGATRMRGQP